MRSDWDDLPSEVRDAIEARTGAVRRVEAAPAGNHANIASTLHTVDGRVFVKAARKEPGRDGSEVKSLRWEAAINRHVAEHAPRLHWTVEAGGWLVLGFEHVRARHADYRPGSSDLETLAEVIDGLQAMPCPDLLDRRRVDRRWGDPPAGETLKAGHGPAQAEGWAARFPSWAGTDPAHLDAYACAFAERWRANTETNRAPWALEHAAAAGRWADHRLTK
ncbi:hypothetical protein [Actinomadura sp. CNU-125]|uniref:hypothetical protein n=1 Tax=Actinomadura sp. CNU-125 TaxID=1904961 RepID=UPI001178B029|nr:hypothetical protein [Actinomadura sp. CNU-125]